MASEFSHAVVALALVKAHDPRSVPRRLWGLSILCSILPDADLVGFAFGIDYGDPLGHRGLTHSLCAALVVSAVVVKAGFPEVARWSRGWWILMTHFFLVTASHGFLDAMTDGGLGVAFFAPFDRTRYFLPWTPVKVSPIGLMEFFTPIGWEVLRSEILWIWIPAGLIVLAGAAFRRLPRQS